MKSIWFHMQGYRDMPNNFREKYDSVWVDPPTDELCDPATAGQYLRWNLDELEYAAELGFDGVGTNEHHQNGYGFAVSPNLTGYHLAKTTNDAAIVMLGNTLPIYQPAIRSAEELAFIDCLSGGRLVAGMPVGTPMDVAHCYGVTPTEVRPRFFEAHDLITQAWTKPGPFTFNGRFNQLRHVNLWPKPVQQDPHPPIWLAGGGSPETWEFAAQQDYTYNYLSFNGRKAARDMMTFFWDEMERLGKDRNPFRAGFAQVVLVAETDSEAERLYLQHVRNFYEKSMHVPMHFGAVPGYNSKRATEAAVKKASSGNAFTGVDPTNASWSDLIESGRIIGGSPATVIDLLTELATDLNVGHLILLMQIQSMGHELTKYNTAMYAEHVMPAIQKLWDESEWPDRWWPSGAKRPSPTPVAGA